MRKYIPDAPLDCDEEFPAFAARDVEAFDGGRVRKVKLVLPANAGVEELLKQRTETARAQEAAHFEAAEAKDETARQLLPKKFNDPPTPSWRRDVDRTAVIDARAELKLKYEVEALRQEGVVYPSKVQIMRWDEPIKLIDPLVRSTPDRELRERDRELFNRLKTSGAFRRICGLDHLSDEFQNLKALRLAQPHFGEVIDFIAGQINVALELATPLRLPPVLLVGPPGVGKTHFTLEIARTMFRPIHRHSFDASHTASSLLGSARNWANTQPGIVFEAVCMGERADPIILLDELDKAQTSRDGSALRPLHSLLEPVTAGSVSDISTGITFDASLVFWLGTANELGDVPGPIQSRFRVFHIQPPSAEQAIDLAHNVAASVYARFTAFEPPDRRVITLLAHLTPREQIQALEQAFGSALVNGRRHLMRLDLPASVLDGDADESSKDRYLH